MLQSKELALIQTDEFFKLKQSATEKIMAELAILKDKIAATSLHQNIIYPEKTDTALGKISKGENYKGLPYLILDYPRLFTQDGVLAFRTMFWWANGFYFTFHISGVYLEKYQQAFSKAFEFWQKQNIFYYQHDEEWKHEVQAPYYFPIESILKKELSQLAEQQGYLKLARRLSLDKIDEFLDYGVESFLLFFSSLKL